MSTYLPINLNYLPAFVFHLLIKFIASTHSKQTLATSKMLSDEDYVDGAIDAVAVPDNEKAVPARDVNERNGKRVRG